MRFFFFTQFIDIISIMSSQKVTSQLSSNSKKLNRFHASQSLNLVLFMVIIAAVLATIPVGYKFYQETINPSTANNTDSNGSIESIEDDSQSLAINEDAALEVDPSTTSTVASTGVAIPEGVNVALKSIEQRGINNNPYITVDTSSIPEGSTFQPDRNSWYEIGTESGSVSGIVDLSGELTNGSLTFQYTNGSWKVTGYSIEN